MICSTLSGQMAIKHSCGLLVRQDGLVLNHVKGRFKDPSMQFRYTKGHLDRDGYFILNCKGKPYKVHRLVAQCFIPNPDNKLSVDHINRNRGDNRVSNLRWATATEQQLNRRRKYDFEYTDRKSYLRAYHETMKKLHQPRH